MNDNQNEQRPQIKFRGHLLTLAERPPEAVLATEPRWISEAEKVHRKIQDEGLTPELFAQFQDVASDYMEHNLVVLHEDGSTGPLPDEVTDGITPREFSAITAAVSTASDRQPYTPTALLQKASSGVLEVQ